MKLASVARLAALPVALVVFAATARSLDAHPLHTSLAEIVFDPAAKEIRISIRVFIDDLTKASTAYARGHKSSSQTMFVDYARSSFIVADRGGHPLALAPCGTKPVGDLMWLCLHAPAPAGISGLQVTHRVLFDLYADQINIVQASYNGKRISLLFTRGDGLKRL
ncbi:MAG: DUF6702 family protein [Gemmatimonadaceae bacterium]